MASSRSMLKWSVALLVILSSFVSSSSCRKLLKDDQQELKTVVAPPAPYLDPSQYLSALPKGRVPSSTPSKKGHSVTDDEKLVSRHLAERETDRERILRSVPSPGVGH